MSNKRILYSNVLDSPGVVVTPSSEDPINRMFYAYDRDIGMPAAFANAASCSLIIDQSAVGGLLFDRLIIAGHNFDGMGLILASSPDGIDWSAVLDSWTQVGSDTAQPGQNLINRTQPLAGQPYNFIGLFWSGNGGTIPTMTEVFIGLTYEMERNPSYGNQVRATRDGVKVTDLHGGTEVYYDHWAGLQKRYRLWPLDRAVEAQAANINALDLAWAGKMPFFVEDDYPADTPAWFFARMMKRADEAAKGLSYSAYTIEVLEVLP